MAHAYSVCNRDARNGMAHTITKTAFEQLPEDDRVLIRTLVNTINKPPSSRMGLDRSMRVETRPKGRAITRLHAIEFNISEVEMEHRERALEERLNRILPAAMDEVRETLTALARSKRLPEGFASRHRRTVFSDALRVEVSIADGRAQFRQRLQFESSMAAVQYAILRLSQITTEDSAALLICEECAKFKLIESTGGDKISRFCSSTCRNRFTVRAWRESQKRVATKARKSK